MQLISQMQLVVMSWAKYYQKIYKTLQQLEVVKTEAIAPKRFTIIFFAKVEMNWIRFRPSSGKSNYNWPS